MSARSSGPAAGRQDVEQGPPSVRAQRPRARLHLRSRKTAETASRPGPCPRHCEPWPENTKTVLPSSRACPCTSGGRRARRGRARPGRGAARPRSAATITARSSSVDRPGDQGVRDVGQARPRIGRERSSSRAACPRSAAPPGPDGQQGRAAGPGEGAGPGSGAPEGCSRITWALVPLIPNAETPAAPGVPGVRPRPGSRSAAGPRPRTSPRAAWARRRAASSAARRAAWPAPS